MNDNSFAEKILISDEEQAVAAWINYLNQLRLDKLFFAYQEQDKNLRLALEQLDKAKLTIAEKIIIQNRGGTKGIHGFIAEVAEVGVDNAKKYVEGLSADNVWINNNGPFDILRGGTRLQVKFTISGDGLSLGAMKKHLEQYPDYLKNKGEYLIPNDEYDQIVFYRGISESEANKIGTANGEFSLKKWKKVHAFFEEGNIPFEKIHPSNLDYKDVQAGEYEKTIAREKTHIKKTNDDIREKIYHEHSPTIQEGINAAGVGAIAEGGMNFVLAVRKACRNKRIYELSEEEWEYILKETGVGLAKGGIRGASIYLLTNYTATPAAVASAIVTSSFGVAQQAYLFRKGEITEEQFIVNSEMMCLDTAVSALSSFIGQTMIPIPVFGAIIGNTIGTFLYQTSKNSLSEKEQLIIGNYIQELDKQKEKLNGEYQRCLEILKKDLIRYSELLESAFVPDCQLAFNGSINLAEEIGVSENDILKNKESIKRYFTE